MTQIIELEWIKEIVAAVDMAPLVEDRFAAYCSANIINGSCRGRISEAQIAATDLTGVAVQGISDRQGRPRGC